MRLASFNESRALGSAFAATAIISLSSVGLANAADVFIPEEPVVSGPSGPGVSFYASAFGGVVFLSDAEFSGTVTPPGGNQTVDIDFDEGFNFGGAIGVSLDYANLGPLTPRFEVELAYRENDANTIDFSGNGAGNENNVGGDISALTLMANVLLDVNTNSPITPFFGGGIGVAFTDIDIVYGGAPGAPAPIRFDDNDTNLAAQAIIGVAYDFTESLSVSVDGRYVGIFDVDGDRFNPGGLTGNIDDDLDSFSVNVGIRYKFGG